MHRNSKGRAHIRAISLSPSFPHIHSRVCVLSNVGHFDYTYYAAAAGRLDSVIFAIARKNALVFIMLMRTLELKLYTRATPAGDGDLRWCIYVCWEKWARLVRNRRFGTRFGRFLMRQGAKLFCMRRRVLKRNFFPAVGVGNLGGICISLPDSANLQAMFGG